MAKKVVISISIDEDLLGRLISYIERKTYFNRSSFVEYCIIQELEKIIGSSIDLV